ncbi:MAG: quaternary ammonium compound efflux SMR transporter SugE [Prosthecobacter sp.]|jgi:quaternary ammonium compound-resistance protein SugE|uniref:quaternary ammonium compound efflux SMR transporter SugE n=1 Tax=Prosthecobacter sp. TaxID=1965333 RepID=UPI0019EC8FB6|nr:quaternary ammonium compound efflux SMR transporter SugE [Prosthecobacter sp.]MBE2286806.1 quaternary ammonium compound efflux SMR transporter SugE [Prosthecobacter sp.]
MPWLHLIIAGLLEVAWAVGLKHTDGWTRFWPSVITALLMIASFFFLSLALRSLPIGTAYAIWTGIGAVGTALIGIFVFHEPRTTARLVCIVLIVAGIIGLKLTSGSQA